MEYINLCIETSKLSSESEEKVYALYELANSLNRAGKKPMTSAEFDRLYDGDLSYIIHINTQAKETWNL